MNREQEQRQLIISDIKERKLLTAKGPYGKAMLDSLYSSWWVEPVQIRKTHFWKAVAIILLIVLFFVWR